MNKIDEKIIFEPTCFDHQNTKARAVIVGITPGNSQLKGEREGLDLREIKRKNAFAGSMRPKPHQHAGLHRRKQLFGHRVVPLAMEGGLRQGGHDFSAERGDL